MGPCSAGVKGEPCEGVRGAPGQHAADSCSYHSCTLKLVPASTPGRRADLLPTVLSHPAAIPACPHIEAAAAPPHPIPKLEAQAEYEQSCDRAAALVDKEKEAAKDRERLEKIKVGGGERGLPNS
jgi:hypothetical protein